MSSFTLFNTLNVPVMFLTILIILNCLMYECKDMMLEEKSQRGMLREKNQGKTIEQESGPELISGWQVRLS